MPHHDQPGPAWYKWLYTWGRTRQDNQPPTYWVRAHPRFMAAALIVAAVLLTHFYW